MELERLKCAGCKNKKIRGLFVPSMQNQRSPICMACQQKQRDQKRGHPRQPRGIGWRRHRVRLPGSL